MEKKYICPCGLICSDCLFHREEIYENAKKLKNSIKRSQLDIFLGSIAKNENLNLIADHLNAEREQFKENFELFNKFADFMEFLDNLIRLQCKTTCRETGGCAIGGKNHSCDAVKCVQDKSYAGCWECPENENCGKLIFVKNAYGEMISENYAIMKEKGAEGLHSRGNKYYAWQRKMNN